MLKTFADRHYPSKPQARLLDSTLETSRRWYNLCLAQRRDAYQQRGESVSKYHQLLSLVKEYKSINPYAKGIHSHVLQIVVTELDKAFQAFFRRVSAGEKPGFPRLKGAIASPVSASTSMGTDSKSTDGGCDCRVSVESPSVGIAAGRAHQNGSHYAPGQQVVRLLCV